MAFFCGDIMTCNDCICQAGPLHLASACVWASLPSVMCFLIVSRVFLVGVFLAIGIASLVFKLIE